MGQVHNARQLAEEKMHSAPGGEAKESFADRALRAIEGGEEGDVNAKAALKDLSKGVDVVAGQRVESAQAIAAFNDALVHVKAVFKGKLDIDLDKIVFEKLDGDQVGEAKEGKLVIDPIMLMHPAVRLAHVIAHEAAHLELDTKNEALVEGFVKLHWERSFGVGAGEEVYAEEVKNFEEFALMVGQGNLMEGAELTYKLYYAGQYDELFALYKDNYVKTLLTDQEQGEAFEFFKTVFPELNWQPEEVFDLEASDPSRWARWDFDRPDVEEVAKLVDDNGGKRAAKVFDMNEYRKRVADREAEVRQESDRTQL